MTTELPQMTVSYVSDLCKERGLFRTPELNEKLYLHYCGFKRIENLEAYTECRALWLENNSIDRIENLNQLEKLETLFIQHNFISSLRSSSPSSANNLTSAPLNVRSLDISHNFLTTLEDIPLIFPQLEKLLASHNRLKGVHATISDLSKSLIIVDISFNEIGKEDGGENDLVSLGTLPQLSSLMMHGNPITKLQYYRKRTIAANSSLTFLDEYPVFPEERRCCTAFVDGGRAAEAKVKVDIATEQIVEKQQQLRFFDDIRASILKNSVGKTAPKITQYFIDHDDETTSKVVVKEDQSQQRPKHVDPSLLSSTSTQSAKSKFAVVTISSDDDNEEDVLQ